MTWSRRSSITWARNRRAVGRAGARGAADAMHVVLGILQIVIEHAAHAGHV